MKNLSRRKLLTAISSLAIIPIAIAIEPSLLSSQKVKLSNLRGVIKNKTFYIDETITALLNVQFYDCDFIITRDIGLIVDRETCRNSSFLHSRFIREAPHVVRAF